MTTNVLTWGNASRPRRATFVPARAAVVTRRWYIGATAAAVVVSAAAVGTLTPLVF